MAAPTSSRAQAASLQIGDRHRVSALIILPPAARACFVFAHGAGAGMNHRFMEAIATGLGDRTIATLRFQFPYMEAGSGRPDPPAVCHATVRAAVEEAARVAPGLPLIAGGRSFGGRMASQAQASSPLPGVRALAFLGFPLHPAKRPSEDRAEHLSQVTIPMLFLQGDRDELAELTLLKSVVARLGSRAMLKVIPDADHSYHVRARSGRKDPQVIVELLDGFVEWLGTVL
jgi:predicted alpha/beta-hydrolase family hydrolase